MENFMKNGLGKSCDMQDKSHNDVSEKREQLSGTERQAGSTAATDVSSNFDLLPTLRMSASLS